MKKFLGFTLAEMLVVIGIIGVVSALTLPNLNNSTGDQEKVAKFLKVYQNLNEAYSRAVVAYGPNADLETFFAGDVYDRVWFKELSDENNSKTRFGKRMAKFLKVQKDCGISGTGCFKSGNYLYLGGNTSPYSPHGYRVILADGTSVSFEYGWITLDIDGPNKGKNQFGDDIFMLVISHDGKSIVPNYDYAAAQYQNFNQLLNTAKQGNGTWASSWIIKFGNADYKKVNSSGKCTNGTTPTETNPRCN